MSESASDRPLVVVGPRSLAMLVGIRHEHLLREMFARAVTADSAAAVLRKGGVEVPDVVEVRPDPTEVEMPTRLVRLEGAERAVVALAITLDSDLLVVEGKPLLEKVKLSYIKAMGAIPLLVQAFQEERIRRVRPLLVALERQGHEMPPPEQHEALLRALEAMGG